MSQQSNLLLQGHQAQVLTLKYNNNSSILASAGMDRNILLWSPSNSYENTSVLKSHTNAVIGLSFSYTDKLVSCSADKNISVWDIQVQKLIRKHKGHTAIVHAVACPKKTLEIIASCGDDNTVRVWDQRAKGQICIFQVNYPLTATCFSMNGDKLFAGGIDNEIKMFNIAQRKLQEVFAGHQDTISCLEISPDGSYLMSNSFDETIRIWDARNGINSGDRLSKTMMGHLQGNEKGLLKGSWTHDGLYVSCGSVDKCVYIWDTTTRKIVQKLGGHTGTVNQVSMGFLNGKSYLASGSNDKTIIISQMPDTFL